MSLRENLKKWRKLVVIAPPSSTKLVIKNAIGICSKQKFKSRSIKIHNANERLRAIKEIGGTKRSCAPIMLNSLKKHRNDTNIRLGSLLEQHWHSSEKQSDKDPTKLHEQSIHVIPIGTCNNKKCLTASE